MPEDRPNLEAENAALRERLAEAESVIRAIRAGEVDAVIVDRTDGARVFTLESADDPYRALVESMSEGAVTLSEGGTILYSNPRLAEMLATTNAELAGTQFRQWVAPEDASAFEQLLQQKARVTGELLLQTARRETLPVHVSLNPLIVKGRGCSCGIISDASVAKHHAAKAAAAEYVRQVNERLREADRLEDEFLATLAHELRNPLAPIRAAAYVLKKVASRDDRLVQAREMIDRQATHMTRLIDDLLEMSRITQGKLELQRHTESLANVISGVADSARPTMEAREHEFVVRLPDDPLLSLGDEQKIAWLERVDRETRRMDPRVVQVMASVHALHELVLVATSDGVLAGDVRPLVRMNVTVIVEQNGRREQGYAGCGGRYRLDELVANDRPLALAREAVRQALVNLEAMPAPAGTMTVVLGPGWPGVLLHEAIGHGLEGDFNRKGTSAFSGRIGERVAAPGCTVVDDGTLAGRRGSLNIDDEGTPTQCTTLIEDGVLRGYMQDRLNARLMGGTSTGNGRRESFAHVTMPRMTNTYMQPGPYDPGEIIASVSRGIYAVNFGGGQVDITSGKFVFSASEAYLIEGGRIGAPIKGATLVGNGPDVLLRVAMVGNDLKLDEGIGVCGKEGQSVPVGVGQPTLRVDGLTVGGTGS